MLDLVRDRPEAGSILAAAGDLLGMDPAALLARADDAALHANRAGQILCVTRALAAAASLALPPSLLVAGYSVGEVAAWGIAGVWPAARTLRLAATRAELMDRVGGAGDMLGFVRGLPRDEVARLVDRFGCAIAIVNPGALFIIGGARRQVERCCEGALARGAAAARTIAVNVASHTPRLAGAVAPFLAALGETTPSPPLPGRALVGAADATLVRGAPDLPGLAAQLDTTVDWATTLEALVERGADRLLELGPGTALTDMVRAAWPALDARALDEFRGIEGASAWIAGATGAS